MRTKRSLVAVTIGWVVCATHAALADDHLKCDVNDDGDYDLSDLMKIHKFCNEPDALALGQTEAESEVTENLVCDMDDDGRYGPRDDLPLIHQYCQQPPLPSGALNDTGIDWCANEGQNFLPCNRVPLYPGQDAHYGRDVTDDDDSDGHAGFSFTKLGIDGDVLPASATDWSCVRDNVTGLVWEVKSNDGGLRDKAWRYTWYNPDPATNGGDAGQRGDGGDACGGEEKMRCNTHAFVTAVNRLGLCGRHDWRLPDRFELESITSNDRYGPAIDTEFFPSTQSLTFWSSSPYVYHSRYAWNLDFADGRAYDYDKYSRRHVRLVSGGQ